MSDASVTDLGADALLLGTFEPEVDRLAGALGLEVTRLPTLGASPAALDPGRSAGRHDGGDWPWADVLDEWRVATTLVGSAESPSGSTGSSADLDGSPVPASTGLGAVSAVGARRDASGPQQVVVAAWAPVRPVRAVVELDLDVWVDSVEAPVALWSAALGVAARQVADGGGVVAVVDRPSPLDCAGHGPEVAVADAVEAMVRSLGRSEGPRGVRVNLVTTPVRTAPGGASDPDGRVVAPPPPLDRYPGTIEDDVAGAVRMLLGPGAVGLTGTVLHADSGRSWR